MKRHLDQLEIANPCPKRWAELEGGDTRRYCDACDLHVTNLSDLPRSAVQDFLDRAAGRTCVTWIPDQEGGIRFAPESAPRTSWGRVAASFLAGLLPFLAACREPDQPRLLGDLAPGPPPEGSMILGRIAAPAGAHASDPDDEARRLVGEVMLPGDLGAVDCEDAAQEGDPGSDR